MDIIQHQRNQLNNSNMQHHQHPSIYTKSQHSILAKNNNKCLIEKLTLELQNERVQTDQHDAEPFDCLHCPQSSTTGLHCSHYCGNRYWSACDACPWLFLNQTYTAAWTCWLFDEKSKTFLSILTLGTKNLIYRDPRELFYDMSVMGNLATSTYTCLCTAVFEL